MKAGLNNLWFSASAIGTFEDCEARFFHEQQRYASETLLPIDGASAALSLALHDAFMAYQRQLEQMHRNGALPGVAEAQVRLRALVDRSLRAKRLDRSRRGVAERLRKAELGVDAVAEMLLSDVSGWAMDPASGDLLVWVESRLDHGPDILAVELAPGFLVRTRPDLIGLRLHKDGLHRIVIRDFKAKGEAVDPAFDLGILVRAIWALIEVRQPRCRWFLAGREILVDPDAIELETINVLKAGSPDFLLRSVVTVDQLEAERERLVAVLADMAVTAAALDPGEVIASPGSLCQEWCPFLNRCSAGQAHVRKYVSDEVLRVRLGQVAA